MESELITFIHSIKEFADKSGQIRWLDGNKLWVQMYPYDTWTHPLYTDTTINREVAGQMVQNFNDGVTGRKAIVDYDHGKDAAKGGKAAGEIVNMEARDTGLWGLVQFNDVAKEEIDKGEWNYWSTSHRDSWTHPQTGESYNFVVEGGALTNRPYVRGMLPLNFSEIFIENPEWSGLTDIDESSDNKQHSDEGGENMDEFEKKLRELLGLDDKADIHSVVKEMSEELGPLRELKREHSEKKQFADLFPDEFARMQKLEAANRDNEAKNFSEGFIDARVTRKIGEGDAVKDEPTTLGFSSLVIEKIRECAKEFSEGKPNFESFKGVLDTIIDNGIVDYGTKGSSREFSDDDKPLVPTTANDARKQFSEKVDSIVAADSLSYEAAYAKAATDNPELYEAYRSLKPVAA